MIVGARAQQTIDQSRMWYQNPRWRSLNTTGMDLSMFDVMRHIFIIPLQNQRNSKGENTSSSSTQFSQDFSQVRWKVKQSINPNPQWTVQICLNSQLHIILTEDS